MPARARSGLLGSVVVTGREGVEVTERRDGNVPVVHAARASDTMGQVASRQLFGRYTGSVRHVIYGDDHVIVFALDSLSGFPGTIKGWPMWAHHR